MNGTRFFGMLAGVCSAFLSTTVIAYDGGDRFDRAFNSAAKRASLPAQATKPECKSGICEYQLSPRGRLSVLYSGDRKTIDEVAAYFSPDPAGGNDAVIVANVLIRVFGSSAPETVRRAAIEQLFAGATGAQRDGETSIGGWRYVLRPSDGRDIRLYVKNLSR